MLSAINDSVFLLITSLLAFDQTKVWGSGTVPCFFCHIRMAHLSTSVINNQPKVHSFAIRYPWHLHETLLNTS